jgi:uncharacterized protein YecT (DUF1311 family)
MAMLAAIALALAAVMALSQAFAQSAEPAKCPFNNNDACDEWQTQELEKELAAIVASATTPAQLTPEQRAQALAALGEAHKRWLEYRDLECRWRVAVDVISARTKRGQLAGCLLNMTWQRRAELTRALPR